jgi:hypothetical protein
MAEPVLCLKDGQLYEKQAITEWVAKQGTSPITRGCISQECLVNATPAGYNDLYKRLNMQKQSFMAGQFCGESYHFCRLSNTVAFKKSCTVKCNISMGALCMKEPRSVTFEIVKLPAHTRAFVGVCVESFNRSSYPIIEGSWGLWSDGDVNKNGRLSKSRYRRWKAGDVIALEFNPHRGELFWRRRRGTHVSKYHAVCGVRPRDGQKTRFCAGACVFRIPSEIYPCTEDLSIRML